MITLDYKCQQKLRNQMKTVTISLIFFGFVAVISAQNSDSVNAIAESLKPFSGMVKKVLRGQKIEGNAFADSIQNLVDTIGSQVIGRFREIGQIGMDEIRGIIGDPKSLMRSFMGNMRFKRQAGRPESDFHRQNNQTMHGNNRRSNDNSGKTDQTNE
jgi:hypothetical protein